MKVTIEISEEEIKDLERSIKMAAVMASSGFAKPTLEQEICFRILKKIEENKSK